MANRFCIGPGMMSIALLLCAHHSAQGGERSGRSQAAARQQVSHALAHAMADGKLTTSESDAILAMAKDRLSPNEFEHLRRRLGGSDSSPNRELVTQRMPSPSRSAGLSTAPRVNQDEALPVNSAASEHRPVRSATVEISAALPRSDGGVKAAGWQRKPAPLPDDVAHGNPPMEMEEALPNGRQLPREEARASWGPAPIPAYGSPWKAPEATPSNGRQPAREEARVSWGPAPMPESVSRGSLPEFRPPKRKACASCPPPQ